MKCKCGGNFISEKRRIKILIRDKIFYPFSYKCDKCQSSAFVPWIHIPIKGGSLRGKIND